jgi:hypothetical protein
LHQHACTGTGFERIDQRQRLPMNGLPGSVPFPAQVVDGRDTDEYKQKQVDKQKGKRG